MGKRHLLRIIICSVFCFFLATFLLFFFICRTDVVFGPDTGQVSSGLGTFLVFDKHYFLLTFADLDLGRWLEPDYSYTITATGIGGTPAGLVTWWFIKTGTFLSFILFLIILIMGLKDRITAGSAVSRKAGERMEIRGVLAYIWIFITILTPLSLVSGGVLFCFSRLASKYLSRLLLPAAVIIFLSVFAVYAGIAFYMKKKNAAKMIKLFLFCLMAYPLLLIIHVIYGVPQRFDFLGLNVNYLFLCISAISGYLIHIFLFLLYFERSKTISDSFPENETKIQSTDFKKLAYAGGLLIFLGIFTVPLDGLIMNSALDAEAKKIVDLAYKKPVADTLRAKKNGQGIEIELGIDWELSGLAGISEEDKRHYLDLLFESYRKRFGIAGLNNEDIRLSVSPNHTVLVHIPFGKDQTRNDFSTISGLLRSRPDISLHFLDAEGTQAYVDSGYADTALIILDADEEKPDTYDYRAPFELPSDSLIRGSLFRRDTDPYNFLCEHEHDLALPLPARYFGYGEMVVEKNGFINASHISSVEMRTGEDGIARLSLSLNPEGREILFHAASKNIGRTICVSYDKHIVALFPVQDFLTQKINILIPDTETAAGLYVLLRYPLPVYCEIESIKEKAW